MSHSANTEILENLYEEALANSYAKNHHLLFSKEEIEECAAKVAQSKFDAMCQ